MSNYQVFFILTNSELIKYYLHTYRNVPFFPFLFSCEEIFTFEIQMLIFQIFLIFFYNEAVLNAECLPKRGYGLSATTNVAPVPVAGQASFQIEHDECQTKCDNLVWGLFNICKTVILLFFRRNVHTLYQSLRTAHCTNVQ